MSPRRNRHSITAPGAIARRASVNTPQKWKPRRPSHDARNGLTTLRPQILGSTGCQPVVAGTPAGNIFWNQSDILPAILPFVPNGHWRFYLCIAPLLACFVPIASAHREDYIDETLVFQ